MNYAKVQRCFVQIPQGMYLCIVFVKLKKMLL